MADKKDQNPTGRKTLSSIKKARDAKSVRNSFASLKGKNQDPPFANTSRGREESFEVHKAHDRFEPEESNHRMSNEKDQRLSDFNFTAPYSQKFEKRRELLEKDSKLLKKESWSTRRGHSITFAAVFLFTLTLYFRPYELIPGLAAFNSLALIFGLITLLIYLPSQIALEGSISFFPTEIKCILFIAFWAFITIPIAKDPSLAWATFVDPFIKIVVIFVVMINCVRTRKRLYGLMWLGIAAGSMLSIQAIDLYRRGEFKVEGYRVGVDFGGMFANPNDMAVHLVMFVPIALILGVLSRNKLFKIIYFSATFVMFAGIMVTQSRGGFLGVSAATAVVAWKVGRKHRVKVVAFATILLFFVMVLAPGNYGVRLLSIFDPTLDPVSSSNERSQLLAQSIKVSLRNPLGIGIGNFPVVGTRNLQTHNAYTQVSSELGLLALAAYLILIVSPLRKLRAIERASSNADSSSWIYYMSIGVQASIVGYMVSSFFGSIAYGWYVYYPIVFAVCLRRMFAESLAEADRPSEKGFTVFQNEQPLLH